MRVRRVLFAVGLAAAIGGVARLVGKDTAVPTSGGWRRLDPTTFR